MLSIPHLARLLGHQQGEKQGDTHQFIGQEGLSLQGQD